MEQIDIVLKSIRSMAWTLALQGILAIVFSILILLYPLLLNALVSVIFMVVGIIGIIAAIKIGKYSKIKV
jgi:uncharacterized membrane protein HdeD (DUF308 family)